MNKKEMIKEMADIIALVAFQQAHEINGDDDLADVVATALYNANYRKIDDDENVIKADIKCVDSTTAVNVIEFFSKHNEKVRKETAREIFTKAQKKAHFKDGGYYGTDRYLLDMKDLQEILKKFDVELEDNNE